MASEPETPDESGGGTPSWFAELRFIGARFDRHELPVSVGPDLAAFEKAVIACARHRHRALEDRARSRAGFLESFSLVIARQRDGSVRTLLSESAATLDSYGAGNRLPKILDDEQTYARDGRDLVSEILSAVVGGRDLPVEDLSDDALRSLRSIGTSLRDHESLEISSPGKVAPVRITKDDLENWSNYQARPEPTEVEERVTLTGKVTRHDAEGTIWVNDATYGQVKVGFARHQVDRVNQAMKYPSALHACVSGDGIFLVDDEGVRELQRVRIPIEINLRPAFAPRLLRISTEALPSRFDVLRRRDSYEDGIEPPPAEVLDRAMEIAQELEAGALLPRPYAFSRGGAHVSLEWHGETRLVRLVVSSDGLRVASLSIDPASGSSTRMTPKDPANPLADIANFVAEHIQ